MNGVTDLDDKVAAILRRSNKPVILVANKCDSNEWRYNSAEFYSFGLGDPFYGRRNNSESAHKNVFNFFHKVRF